MLRLRYVTIALCYDSVMLRLRHVTIALLRLCYVTIALCCDCVMLRLRYVTIVLCYDCVMLRLRYSRCRRPAFTIEEKSLSRAWCAWTWLHGSGKYGTPRYDTGIAINYKLCEASFVQSYPGYHNTFGQRGFIGCSDKRNRNETFLAAYMLS